MIKEDVNMKVMITTHDQKIIKDNRAFTLIEMIIGLAIASMVCRLEREAMRLPI